MHREAPHRPAPNLHQMHGQLRTLYAREYPEGAPHLYERLLPKLTPFIRALVRRKLDLLTREETGERKSHEELDDADRYALSGFFDPQVLRAYLDMGRDSALSNDGHFIAHFDTQPTIVAQQLIRIAAEENPEALRRTGCVFFDVDGTKTIVDCTSHAHAGKYLESLAEFLCKPPEQIRQWLLEHGMKSEAYSVAGDEFIVTLHSEVNPVEKQQLDAFALEVQRALAADTKLASFVSFDDPEFIMEYDEWTDDDRAAWKREPSAMQERLAASRGKLPERFIPSVSCGSATFLEALEEALSPDTEEAKTLEELGVNAFRLMVERADARLKEDKRVFREKLEDPLWKAFLLRNAENRRLMGKITDLEGQVADLQRRLHGVLERRGRDAED